MKKAIITAIIGLIALLAVFFFTHEGKCAWCPTYKCFGAGACGSGCVCITNPGEVGGYCYGVERR